MNNQDSYVPAVVITVIGFIVIFGLMIMIFKLS